MNKEVCFLNKLSKCVFGVLFFLLIVSGSVNAATYYVATNGDNSNPGTLALPWLTIQYAADNVAPGDIVYIRAGTYAKWKVNVSGAVNSPITFKNYPGELPVINGNWTSGHGVEIRGVSHIIIDGIRFYQISGNGVHIEGSTRGEATPASDIIIRNCQIDGTSNAGIYVCGLIMGSTIPVDDYRTFDITIEYNDITNTNYPSGGNECISLGGGTDGFIIRYNYVHDSRQYGIDAKFGARNGKIYGNVIHNMKKHGIYIDTNARTIENIDIYNNFVYNCEANGLTLARESARTPKVPNLRNIRIFDNVFTGCRRGILAYIHPKDNLSGDFKDITIVNNTIHDNIRDIDPHSIKIINISDVENHGGWIIANNLTSKNDGPAFINSSDTDWIITNNVNSSTDAPYVDASNRDFHLVSGSIAEGTADATYLCKSTDHDGVPRGTPPDCGAFEYTGIIIIPNAPSSLSTTAVSSSQVNLSWTDNSRNEDGFKIERKTGAGSYSEIDQVRTNETSYSDTGLSASTTYTYRVRAHNTAGNSSYSNEAIDTTLAPIPNAPSSLSAAPVSSSQIDLSWTDNASNEDGFKIERKTGAGSYSKIDQVGINVTSYSDTGLTALTTYTYRVCAYNTSGNSSYSNEDSATTQSAVLLVGKELERDYTLGCYPNPFNQTTTVQFGIPPSDEGKKVELNVNNTLGHLVSTLLNNNLSSGLHEIEFNASELSGGMYIFRLQSGDRVLTQRALLIK